MAVGGSLLPSDQQACPVCVGVTFHVDPGGCACLLCLSICPLCSQWCRGPAYQEVGRRGVRMALLSLQDLGVTKVGHMKRILCGIKELNRGPPSEA